MVKIATEEFYAEVRIFWMNNKTITEFGFRLIFNNYSPQAQWLLLNNPRDEVEGIIQQ